MDRRRIYADESHDVLSEEDCIFLSLQEGTKCGYPMRHFWLYMAIQVFDGTNEDTGQDGYRPVERKTSYHAHQYDRRLTTLGLEMI